MQRRSFLKSATVGVRPGPLRHRPSLNRTRHPVANGGELAEGLDTLFGAAEFVTKRVSEITDGKFQIRVFAAGEIVPALQVLDAVQAVLSRWAITASYYYFGKDPAFALGTSVPFGPTTRQSNAWWYFGGGAEAMAPLYSEYGCIAILGGNTGCQMGGWFRKEIKSVDDLKGLKFRIGGMAGCAREAGCRAADDRWP